MNYEHRHEQVLAILAEMSPTDAAAGRYAAAASRVIAGKEPEHRRAAHWVRTLHAYEAFWEGSGRTPRENTRARHTLHADERHLGEWARYQRRFEEHLNAYQRARLEVSPAFTWDLRRANWERNLIACHAHRQRTGELPRLTAKDTDEFALARWLGRQLRRLQLGQLEPQQAQRLGELLQPWKF